MNLKSLSEEALNLSRDERVVLIDTLWKTLTTPEELAREALWGQESEERIDAVDRGELPTGDGPLGLRQIRDSLRR